jgi:diguanylate cyclase (GGDEF)-like protein
MNLPALDTPPYAESSWRAGSSSLDSLARLLLVHDDPVWLMRTAKDLRERGFLVSECSRPVEAGDLIDEARPDAVVIDAGMSAHNGHEVCLQVRQHPGCADVPILMLTPDASDDHHRRAQQAGATDVFTHQADPGVLTHRVRQMLWVARLERTLGGGGSDPSARASLRSARFIWRSDSGEVRGSEELFRLFDRHAIDDTADAGWLLASAPSRQRRRLQVALSRLLRGQRAQRMDFDVRTRSAGTRRLSLQVHQVLSLDESAFEVSGLVQDVTPESGAEARAYRLTHYDTLTGLPNRTWFVEKLRSGPPQDARGVAVALLDIDRYTEVLEAFGQEACDRLISEVAKRLRRLARAESPRWSEAGHAARLAVVAYLGGDEFGLMMENLSHPDEGLDICRNVVHVLSEPVRVGERELFLNPSLGLHAADPNVEDPIGWLGRAEIARRAAATLTTGRFLRFDPSMSDAAGDRLSLERDLHYALDRGELSMHLQPKFAVRSGNLVGFEALMRWTHRGQLQSPARFIPIAERNGLIVPLGEWAIDQTCAAIAALSQAGLGHCRISVNLSAQQLTDGRLPDVIAACLARHGVPAELLEVELTESGLMQDPELAVAVLCAIRALGVGLAVDDFGTGYSSLAYLTRLPLTTLKIDRTFVQDADHSETSQAVASAIISLAHSLRLDVVAEGVETEAQRDAMLRLGCDQQQGFLFGRAQPLLEVIRSAHIPNALASATHQPAQQA